MDAVEIKNIILEDTEAVEKILQDLGMHHICLHNNEYYTFGLPDGDNNTSTTLYLDDLGVKAYTREEEHIADIIDLVKYAQKVNKTMENPTVWTAVGWLYEELGVQTDNYSNKYTAKTYDNPFAKLQNKITGIIETFKNDQSNTVNDLQKQLSKDTLRAYLDWNNIDFLKDNIYYDTQEEFGIGIDVFTHRATIPIRDELGRLVGVKGRRIFDVVDEDSYKYIYLHQCSKSEILFGLDKTLPYIKEKDEVIICESEKGVMQLWSYGVKNAVGIGCHSMSKTQVEKIIRINVSNVVIAYDKDVSIDELIEEYNKLCDFADVTCIIDDCNTLDEKESPMDNSNNWTYLYEKCRCKLNRETGERIEWYNLIL